MFLYASLRIYRQQVVQYQQTIDQGILLPKNSDTRKIAVIILKFEQCDFTTD